MSSRKLLVHRLIKGWLYQYGVIKSIADWTVMLYIIIPAITIFSFVYHSWWSEIPKWMENVPFFLLFLLLYLLTWNGHIRTYTEAADRVFLMKKYTLFWGLKKWGYGYSLMYQTVLTLASFAILLPFLLNLYHFDWKQIGTLLFYFISLKTGLMFIKYQFVKIETRFKKFVYSVLTFILAGWLSQLIYFLWEIGLWFPLYLIGVLIMSSSIYLSLRALKKLSSTDHEIEIEQKLKTGNIELIFAMAPEIEKPVVTKRTKPLLFRQSKRIFKNRTQSNGFIELFIKVFLRNYSYVSGYIVMINVTTFAIVLLPPLWIKITIFTGYLFMMYFWISVIWDRIMGTNPMMKKYLESPSYFTAKKKVIMVLYIIAIMLLLLYFLFAITLYSRFGLGV
ncbi:ABC transporter permease [Neobacillus niacini]|uniref:ABC transporter permease n=1 Tax=Neobacillus niacini TaxID=86668 RepID=UPI001C8E0286|nr:ABC transporter permease [Neobacillus niacini]MBY0147393.1 ABC transporter permease [Neobacillus niacini]